MAKKQVANTFADHYEERDAAGTRRGFSGTARYSVRFPLPGGSVGMILGLEFVALLGSWLAFGFDLWVPVLFFITSWWLMAQFRSPMLAMLGCNAVLGLVFSEILYGLPAWGTSCVGVLVAMFLALSFQSGGVDQMGAGKSGDANPIPYIVAVIATRAFLALKYATVTGVDGSINVLTWLALFVVGAVPDAPLIVNAIMVVGLQGTLVTYLVLLLKRMTNLVAN